MKKIIALVLALTYTLVLVSCTSIDNTQTDHQTLTIEKVKKLAEKGEDLTWSDSERYPSEDIGSGLCIYRYEIDRDYYLLIGGGSTELPPMYIRLVSAKDRNSYIDIRTENIDDFIK